MSDEKLAMLIHDALDAVGANNGNDHDRNHPDAPGWVGTSALTLARALREAGWFSPEQVANVRDLLGEGVHTSFRKGSDCLQAHQIWKLIQDMPSQDWSSVINFLAYGLGLPPRRSGSAGADG